MSQLTFDALEYAEELEAAGMSTEQAKAFAKANSKAFSQMVDARELATKRDLKEMELALRHDMEKMKNDLLKHMQNMFIGFAVFIVACFGVAAAFLR